MNDRDSWAALAEHVDSGFAGIRAEIRGEIASVRDEMGKGFTGVHSRQDLTNGNVTELRLWRARMQGAGAALGPLGRFGLSVLLLGIGAALAVAVPRIFGG